MRIQVADTSAPDVPRSLHPLLPFLGALVGGTAVGLAVALGPAPIVVVGGLAALLAAILILSRPELAIPVAVGVVYSNAVVVAAQFHGVPYALALVIPALLLLPVLDQVVVRREPLVGLPLVGLLGVYLVVLLLSAIAARDPSGATNEVWRFATEGAILYVLLLQGVRTSTVLWVAIGALLLVGGILGLLSVIQQATGSFDNDFLGFARITSRGFALDEAAGEAVQLRVGGPMGEQNRYAQVMLALVPLGIVALRHARSVPIRAAVAVSLLLIVTAVALTFSRGAIVGAVILLAGLFLFGLVRWRGLAVVGALLTVGLVAIPGLLGRLVSVEEVSSLGGAGDPVIAQRLNDMFAAFLVFVEQPLLGVGPGQFSTVYQSYAQRVPGLAGTVDFEAHTLYGEVAAETGVLGLIAFFGLIAATIVLLLGARRMALRAERPHLADLAAGFVLVIIVHLATGLFLHLSYPRYFWVLMGLAAAAAVIVRREASQPTTPAAAGAMQAQPRSSPSSLSISAR